MAKLKMTTGRDFNFIFAGSERLFLRGFKEMDIFHLLLEKFSEPVNGGKKFLVAFSGDGKYLNVSFLGPGKYADMIDGGMDERARKNAEEIIKGHMSFEEWGGASGGYEDDEFLSGSNGGGQYGDGSEWTGDPDPGEQRSCHDGEDDLVFKEDVVPDVDYKSAIDYLEDVMNHHREGIIVIDSDVITNATDSADIGWLVHFFDEVKKRSWSDDNTRATVLILFERDGCLEEFQHRMGGDKIPDFLYANVSELSSPMISGLSLKIMPPEISDLRNLTFKRMLYYERKDSLHLLDEYVNLLNQAVSDSEQTGCRTLTQIDNVLRYVLGSDDHSLDNLKRALSLDKVRTRKTWDDLLGDSANKTEKTFKAIAENLTGGNPHNGSHAAGNDDGRDPTFYYRTDVRSNVRLKGIPHFTLTGEPGTGKTTMASIMAAEFYKMGVIKSDCPVIVNLGERLSNQNLSWIHYLFEVEGRDRLIFIDEIESAVKAARGDWGEDSPNRGDSILASALQMFVTKLLSVTTDSNSDTIVCLAGYERGIQEFLRLDKGLLSRFPHNYPLGGYNGEVLCKIFKKYLEREYGQKVKEGKDDVIIGMFDELHSGLSYEDMDGWANARTAETIADKAHLNEPSKEIDEDVLRGVAINIGSRAYELSDYIRQGETDPLKELGKFEGAKELTDLLSVFDRRSKAEICLPPEKNIALICETGGQYLNRVLRLIGKFFKSIDAVDRPIIRSFNYSATLSPLVDRPTVLTEDEFNKGVGGVLVFESPSEHFRVNERTNGDYTGQTRVIRREARRATYDSSSKTVMVVIETPEGWNRIEEEFGDFASLFRECTYSVADHSMDVEQVFKRLKEMEVKMDDGFMESMREEFKKKRPRDPDTVIDEILVSEEWNEQQGDERMLTEQCVRFFREADR